MFDANQLIGKHREVEPPLKFSTISQPSPLRQRQLPRSNSFAQVSLAMGCSPAECVGKPSCRSWRWHGVHNGCSVEAEAQGLLSEASASLVGDARAGKGAEFTKNERCPKICIVLVGLKMMTSHVLAKFETTPHGTPKCAPENSRSSRTKSWLCQLLGVCTSEFITGWK